MGYSEHLLPLVLEAIGAVEYAFFQVFQLVGYLGLELIQPRVAFDQGYQLVQAAFEVGFDVEYLRKALHELRILLEDVSVKNHVALFFIFRGRKLALVHGIIEHLVHPSFDDLVHLLVFVVLVANISCPLAIHLY